MRAGGWAGATVPVVLTAALLAGCGVDQQKEVGKYRRVLESDARTELAADYQPGETLTLQRALLLANRDNERLAIAGENYLQALIEKDRAASSFLPTVALEPSYTVADRAGSGSGGAVGTIGGFRPVGSTLRRFEAPVLAELYPRQTAPARLRPAGFAGQSSPLRDAGMRWTVGVQKLACQS